MSYEVVELLGLDDSQIGYAIRKSGTLKLDSLNVYAPEEYEDVQAEVKARNERDLIRQYWPMPNESEVQDLLNDPDFDPIQYEEVDVPDWDNSDIKYVEFTAFTGFSTTTLEDAVASGQATPEGIAIGTDGQPVIDYPNSTIVTKKELQPVRVQGRSRIDAACETVARERAGIDGG